MSKEHRRLNDLEKHLLAKMRALPSFRKFADELLLELIATGTILPRSEDEINNMCQVLYEGLENSDDQESQNNKSRLN
jgi:hypothetical protein